MARWVMSMPIHRRSRRCAAATVVPQPQKGSRTTSPSLLLAEMIRSRRASGFCVGYPSRSEAAALIGWISVQMSRTATPGNSSRRVLSLGEPPLEKAILPAFDNVSIPAWSNIQCRPAGGSILQPKKRRGGPCPAPLRSESRHSRPSSSRTRSWPRTESSVWGIATGFQVESFERE